MNRLKRYNDIFCRIFKVDPDELNDSFTFKGIKQWDSLAHLLLISTLEEEFGIVFTTEDILHFESYENGKKILTRMGVEI